MIESGKRTESYIIYYSTGPNQSNIIANHGARANSIPLITDEHQTRDVTRGTVELEMGQSKTYESMHFNNDQ